MKRLLILLVIGLSAATYSKADHFIGSDFAWECLGKDTFKVTLTFYQDCNGCHFGVTNTGCTWELCPLVRLNVGSSCGTKTYTFKQISHEDITPVCDGQCTRCTDCACSFKFGIRKHVLETIIYVGDHRKKNCCEFTLSYQLCCRSTGITSGGRNNSFYVSAILNACQDPCDNSPKFTGAPVSILCVGQDFIYNQGVVDFDIDPTTGQFADSLVYSFAEPMATSGAATTWSGGFSYDKPLTFLGFPKANLPFPRGLHLDEVTGDLSFRPMKEEITIMAILVEQYRDGKKISETRRDIQIIVVKCPDNSPPVISGIGCSNPKGGNFSTTACAGETLCFTVCTTDKNKNDTVTVDWNKGIPGGTFTVPNKGKSKRETGKFCWTPTDADVSSRPHSFTVSAKDNACPVNGFSVRLFRITVKASPKANYDTLVYDCGNARFTAEKVGPVNIAQYMWVANGYVRVKAGGNVDTTRVKFKYPGQKKFSLTLFGKNGCNNLYEDTITIPKFVNITTNNDTILCEGETLNLSAEVRDSSGNAKVWWSTGENKKRTTSITVGKKDTFVIVNVKDLNCENSDTCFIRVNLPPDIKLGPDARICPGSELELVPVHTHDTLDPDSIISYEWYRNNLSNLLATSDTIYVSDSAKYYVRGSDSTGCSTVDSMNLFVNQDRNWQPFDQSICENDSVHLKVNNSGFGSKFFWYNSPQDLTTPIWTGLKFSDKPKTTKTYGIKWTETYQGVSCEELDSVLVKVNPLPDVKTKPIDPVCEDQDEISLVFYGEPLGGIWFDTSATKDYVRFNRFFPREAGSGGDKPITHRIGYVVEDFVTKCTDTAYANIRVKNLPEVELNKDTVFICQGEINTPRELGQYVVKQAGKGEWTGDGVVEKAGKYYFDMKVMGSAPVSHVLNYTFAEAVGGPPSCSSSLPMVIKIVQTPVAIAGTYDPVCIDAPDVVFRNAKPRTEGGKWYYIDDPLNWTLRVDNKATPIQLGAGLHEFAYVFTEPKAGCADTAFTTLKVNALPEPNILHTWDQINDENHICFSESPKRLSGNTTDAAGSYSTMTWEGPGVYEEDDKAFFSPALGDLGQQYITYSVVNEFGCEGETDESVFVDQVKDAKFKNGPACLGDSVLLEASLENASEIIWTTSGEGVFSGNEGFTTYYKPAGADLSDKFEITVETLNPNNVCPEVSFSNVLEVHPLPKAILEQSDTIGCAPLDVTFTNKSTVSKGKIQSVLMDYGHGGTASFKGTNTESAARYGVEGPMNDYYGKMTVTSKEGCVDDTLFRVTALLSPISAFTPKPGVTTIIDPVFYFENKSQYILSTTNAFDWHFGDPEVDEEQNISLEEHGKYTYRYSGAYDIRLVSKNVHSFEDTIVSCSDTLIKEVIVEPEVLVFIPTAFTPDNEGIEKNNVFKPEIKDAIDYHIKVFNRWGELMWESRDVDESWDGNFENIECPVGVYVYTVLVTNQLQTEYEFTGTVTLIR